MATVYHQFAPEEAIFLGTLFPQYKKINGTNFPVSGLYFDAATTEQAFFKFRAVSYGSGNLTLDVDWYADTASADEIRIDAAISVITPNGDTQDVETDALATVSSVTDTHLGTTNQRLHRATVTISNLDSLAADDWVMLMVQRDHDHADDDMSGDAVFTLFDLSYSDT